MSYTYVYYTDILQNNCYVYDMIADVKTETKKDIDL